MALHLHGAECDWLPCGALDYVPYWVFGGCVSVVRMKQLFFVFGILLFLGGCATVDENEQAPSGTVKEFLITAQNWNFTPSTIRVNHGDTVIIHAKTIEGIHGFMIPDFDVNKRLDPGEEITIQFIADKKGTFPFACSVYCGEGHTHMTGTLIVE